VPRLARLRLASVGHPHARFNDLVLDFRDASGHATDSTIWLRNGGGKSSILNLFFALLRPDKREFLGGRADAKRRRLEDYILRNDLSVVAAEWHLDSVTTRLEFMENTDVYLTGIFYEWRSRTGGDSLKRLFFAARSSDDDNRTNLEDIPLYVDSKEGKGRRRLASFRQEWMELRTQHPHLGVVATDNQREWQEVLEGAGIDPELYSYQIRMNQREGSVDELFRFTEHEHFIDFLLELVIDPALGQKVGRNISTYRRELKERKDRLLPERELMDGLASRIQPLSEVSKERQLLREKTTAQTSALNLLKNHISMRIFKLQEEAEQQAELAKKQEEEAKKAEAEACAARRRAASLKRFAARLRHEKALEDLERTKRAMEEAQRQMQIWEAAIPLRNALRFERQAEEYRRELERKRAEYAPVLDELKKAATEFAGALLSRFNRLRQEEGESQNRSREAREEAKQSWKFAAECRELAAKAEAEIRRLEGLMQEMEGEREGLERKGALLKGESGAEGKERLLGELEQLQERQRSLTESITRARKKSSDFNEEKLRLTSEASRLEAKADSEEDRLKNGLEVRQALEEDHLLKRYLEVETLDIERMSEDVLDQLRDAARRVLDSIVHLRLKRAEDERAVVHR